MIEETPKTREEWIVQTNTNRGDAIALAQQGRNELIELAWDTYAAARTQAGAIYEATEKDIELVFQAELAAIEVEMAAKTGPAADQLPETVGSSAEQSDEPGVPLQERSDAAAGSTNIGYGPEDQELDVSPMTTERKMISARIDEIGDWQDSIVGLSRLADEQARSDGERRIIGDGLQALGEIVLDVAAGVKRRAEQLQANAGKGGNTDEVNEGGG